MTIDRDSTDRAVNHWALNFLFGPASALSLLSFFIGYWFPGIMDTLLPVTQLIGLNHLVAIRSVGPEFNSAAYFYWVSFWVLIPLNLFWLYREGITQKLPVVLREIAQTNLSSGVWELRKYTLRKGQVRFSFCLLITVLLFIVQLVSAHEPSYCKGCETTGVIGFLLINWLGTHLILIAMYFSLSYLIFWKSICLTFGEKNE